LQETILDSAAPAGASGHGARPNASKVNDVYDFGATLGTGGFAVVRLATSKSTGKEVAMKCMTLPKKKVGLVGTLELFHIAFLHLETHSIQCRQRSVVSVTNRVTPRGSECNASRVYSHRNTFMMTANMVHDDRS
jgi:serine/threonine protein kinase